jgi:hypothetical protein
MVKTEEKGAYSLPVFAGLAGILYNATIHILSSEGKWQYVLIFALLAFGIIASGLLQSKIPAFLRGTVLPFMIIGLGLAIGGYAHYALTKGLIPYLFVILGTGYFISGGMKLIDRV